MRTRYMKLSDYGVPKDDQKRLYHTCKSLEDEEVDTMRKYAEEKFGTGLASYLVLSLTNGVSYGAFSRAGHYIPSKSDDFYGYRRKLAAMMYDHLVSVGKWE